ncbi:MAG: ATP synthase F0 subunit C [Deltaproteobacteria bacterium]|nr:ATP synthase F0 subunit C [Deltaproteobacteria bacterium]
MTSLVLWVPSAMAQAANAADNDLSVKKIIAGAAAFAIAIAAFGGALAQGRSVAAALDGIARNPGASGKMFVPMILGLALIESLVIYAFVIAIMLTLKL